MVTQRSAKPCTPVQFRAWPPAPSIDRQAAFGGPTADAAHSLPRISGAPDFERATAKARASAALGRRQREYPVAEPGRIANRENDMFRLNLCHAAKYYCYAASVSDSFGIPAYIRRSDSWKSPLAQRPSLVTTLALSALIDIAPRWFSRVGRYWTEFSTGIEEARAMALRYQTLAALSDRELAARGLKRQDIPRAALGVLDGV